MPVSARGGVYDVSPPAHGGPASRFSAIGVLCVGLGTLMSLPIPATAQGTCTNTPTGAGTPPTVTITTIVATQVKCTGLTQGLTFTLDTTKAQIGTSASSRATGVASGEGALYIRPDNDGSITVVSRGSVYSSEHGILVNLASGKTGNMEVDLQAGTIDATKTGVWLAQYGTGDITFKTSVDSTIKGGSDGVDLQKEPNGRGDITVVHNGKIDADKAGFRLTNVEGDSITVTTGADSVIDADTIPNAENSLGIGISARVYQKAGRNGTITITHNGKIDAEHDGISALMEGNGDIKITHNGKIDAAWRGMFVRSTGTGSVEVETGAGSSITASGAGTYKSGINASVRTASVAGTVKVTHKGTITADHEGIFATNRVSTGTGAIMITAVKGSTITAKRHGIRVRHDGRGEFDIKIRGTVVGGSEYVSGDKYAGIHIASERTAAGGKGGEITVGPWGHVRSGAMEAIKVDAYAGPVTIILEEDDAGVVGHVEGDILNPAINANTAVTAGTRSALTFKTRTVSGTVAELKEDGIVYRRGETTGVYDKVIKAQLTKLDEGKGYRFEDDTTMDRRLYSDRSRLYEVLPSVLLGLVELSPYSVRMAASRLTGGEAVMVESTRGERVAAPHSDMGVWVRLAAREGDRRADAATTTGGFRAQPLSWDAKRTAVEAGLDLPTDDDMVLGVSAHYRQSKATVKMGGTVEATGVGLGVSATWTDDRGLYVDGQLAYTRFSDIEVRSNSNGLITSGGGTGLAVGVEVGQPMSWANMTVTPRGGLSWSSVDMDAFAEPAALPGAGTVAPDDGQSVQARVGVLAELGPADADTRLYASLDVEHEFSPKFDVMAAGTKLTTKVKPTWVRLGVGGAMPLGGTDATMLAGDAFYATAGSGNADFGGGIALNIRF